MKKINQLMLSLLVLGTLSSGIIIPQNVSASHLKYTQMNTDNASHLKYKLKNPSFRKRVLKNNRRARRYLKAAYDISSYQGHLTAREVKHLKNEIHFAIFRAEGKDHEKDAEFSNNAWLCQKYRLPYGVYSYSYYSNVRNAKYEAYKLYKYAPHAKFYVNDIEANYCGSKRHINAATKAWAQEMHKLTKRPVVIYSGLCFMNEHFTSKTRNAYNAIWLAAYGPRPLPNYHYDLWQKSDAYYSRALGEQLDEDVFPVGAKPLSFWTGGTTATSPKRKAKTIVVNPTKKSSKLNNTVRDLNNDVSKVKVSRRMSRKNLINNGNKAIAYLNRINKLQKNYKLASSNDKAALLKDSNALINKVHEINTLLSKKNASSHKVRKVSKKAKAKKSRRRPKGTYSVDGNTIRLMPKGNKKIKQDRNGKRRKLHRISYKTAMKLLHQRNKKGKVIRINYTGDLKHYYISSHIHSLEVKVWRISIFSRKTHKRIGFLYKHDIIRHVKFHIVMMHNRILTRASGSYHGRQFNTTSRKGYVKPVK